MELVGALAQYVLESIVAVRLDAFSRSHSEYLTNRFYRCCSIAKTRKLYLCNFLLFVDYLASVIVSYDLVEIIKQNKVIFISILCKHLKLKKIWRNSIDSSDFFLKLEIVIAAGSKEFTKLLIVTRQIQKIISRSECDWHVGAHRIWRGMNIWYRSHQALGVKFYGAQKLFQLLWDSCYGIASKQCVWWFDWQKIAISQNLIGKNFSGTSVRSLFVCCGN